MGKREAVKKPRAARDYYGTIDPDAIPPLIEHFRSLPVPPRRYIEPCAGEGHLIDQIARSGFPIDCVGAYDIVPQALGIMQQDCLTFDKETLNEDEWSTVFITNPPFSWPMLKPILDKLPTILPTWLLLPADSMHNKRMIPYMNKCKYVLSVGRLCWFPDQNGNFVKGVDNYAWFCFTNKTQLTTFTPRLE